MFEFENLIPKPYRRDHNPFAKRLDRKLPFDLKPYRRDKPAQRF
ncbi:MAG TPA: hypothetical protein VN414_07760 [Methanosarcina sp.]|nr:hypothetical protein [Methanosarcina sp.]